MQRTQLPVEGIPNGCIRTIRLSRGLIVEGLE
jgi:hypothetical protein